MSVYLYPGGFRLIRKSGVGQAILHQRKALAAAGIPLAQTMAEGDIVHINTVFPDSLLAALTARLSGKRVVYYAHSTMEDFRRSFPGSNWLAPLFKRWIKLCYQRGDVIITPTDYSRGLLLGYGIQKPIYSLTNGVDTEFFAPSKTRRQAFRRRYGLSEQDQVVISAGHTIERKGILDYIALAWQMPQVKFFWFGHTPACLTPEVVRSAMAEAPPNLFFAGYIGQEELRDAYCGADVFAFLSFEETEGIVVLEALSCGISLVLRDIPVYQGWLPEGGGIWKAHDLAGFQQAVCDALARPLHDMGKTGPDECAAVAPPGTDLEPVGAAPVPGCPQFPAAAVRRLRRLAAEGLFLPELRGEIPRDLSFLWDQLRSGRPILRPLRIVPEACGMLRSC